MIRIAGVLLGIAAVASQACASVDVSLRPENIEGPLYFTMTQKTESEEIVGARVGAGTGVRSSSFQEQDIIVSDIQRTDDGYTLQIKYERIYFEQSRDGMRNPLIFDSNVPPDEVPAGFGMLENTYRPIVGIELELSLDGTGEIVSVDRLRVPNRPMLELDPEPIYHWVSLEAAKKRFGPLFRPLPSGTEIEEGESETIEYRSGFETMLREADFTETYTVEEITEGSATVSIEGTGKIDFGDLNYVQTRDEIRGTIEWNRDLGVVEERTYEFEYKNSGETSRGEPLVQTTTITRSIIRR